jgi:hypothetical protein
MGPASSSWTYRLVLCGGISKQGSRIRSAGRVQAAMKTTNQANKQERQIMLNRTRLVLAGLVVLLALSSVMAAPVSAFPGPFWRQRAVGVKTNGVKITQAAQEKFLSVGGKAVFRSPGVGIVITCLESQDKGTIWNNQLQGQGKIQVAFHNCTVTGNGTNCKVVEPIKFSSFFHLAWKWNGTKAQLAQGNQESLGQKWDILFTPREIVEGAENLSEKEEFVTVNFTPEAECTFANSTILGFESAQPYPTQIGTWTNTLVIVFIPGRHLQHFWNGARQVGVETGLKAFGLVESTFEGEDEANTFAAANGEPVEVSVAEN